MAYKSSRTIRYRSLVALVESTKAGSRLSGEMANHLAALAKATYPAAWAKHYPRGAGKYEPAETLVSHYRLQMEG